MSDVQEGATPIIQDYQDDFPYWYGEHYHDPDYDEANLWMGEYDELAGEKAYKHYKKQPTKHLIAIGKYGDAEDTELVLEVLYEREPATAIELAHAILTEGKGEHVTHEWAIEFLTKHGETIGKIKRPVMFGPYDDEVVQEMVTPIHETYEEAMASMTDEQRAMYESVQGWDYVNEGWEEYANEEVDESTFRAICESIGLNYNPDDGVVQETVEDVKPVRPS